jgi:hypothetical protein
MKTLKITLIVVLALVVAVWLYACTPDVFYGTGLDTLTMYTHGLVIVTCQGRSEARIIWGEVGIGVYGRWKVTILQIVPNGI